MWIGGYLIVLLLAAPFVRKGDDRLQLWVIQCLLCLMIGVLTIEEDSEVVRNSTLGGVDWFALLDISLSVGYSLLHLAGVIFAAVQIYRNLKKIIQNKKEARAGKPKVDTSAQASDTDLNMSGKVDDKDEFDMSNPIPI